MCRICYEEKASKKFILYQKLAQVLKRLLTFLLELAEYDEFIERMCLT